MRLSSCYPNAQEMKNLEAQEGQLLAPRDTAGLLTKTHLPSLPF